MLKHKISRFIYRNFAKPIAFSFDPEETHDFFIKIGSLLGKNELLKKFTFSALSYHNPILNQKINKLDFKNPVGLAAGYDYDANLIGILPMVGFGFNTVGTVTAKPYDGNPKPRLVRLPKSQSLLVNKGFKSLGVDRIFNKLSNAKTTGCLGVSIGSSNTPEINNANKAIDDYLYSFEKLKDLNVINFFELNISCPNISLEDNFTNERNLKALTSRLAQLKIKKPIYVKMPNELDVEESKKLVKVGIENGMSGFIFSNLVKNRNNKYFVKDEINQVVNLKGNFSGKPTEENSNRLISEIYKDFKNKTTIIGCGGIFSAEDAYKKIRLGANLVQLITGMIYEGPQLIGEINEELVILLNRDGFKNISEAVGVDST